MVHTGSSDRPEDAARGRSERSGAGRKRRWIPDSAPSWRAQQPDDRPRDTPSAARAERRYPWDEDEPAPTRPLRQDNGGRGDGRRRHDFTPPPSSAGTRSSTGHGGGHGGDRRSNPPPTRELPKDRPRGPRKITVTRVAAWRSRELTQRAVHAFRRAVRADGAGESGLAALTYAVMLNYATDATVAVALANTLFFSAATGESKSKVALYLLITVAPFAVIAPVIGPALDRVQHGRRVALAASFVGQAVLAVVMALHFHDWLLYPAALGSLVLSKSFNVLKAAVTPRVLPTEITLVKTNSRLTMFGLVAGGVFGAIGAGFAELFNSPGALWFTAVVCLAGAAVCLRIPAWVEVTEGEVPASLRGTPKRARQPIGRGVAVALWGNGTIRVLTGFLTLFAAFVIKGQTEHDPVRQLTMLGFVGAAAGIGNFAGNGVGARLQFTKPSQVVLACGAATLAATALAAAVQGIATVVVLGLIASVASALAKVCLDAVIQRDLPEASRASAFGRSETILQLGWVFGGALGVLLPPVYWIGFTVLSALLALGLAQTALVRGRSSLLLVLRGLAGTVRGRRRAAPAGRARRVAEPVGGEPRGPGAGERTT